MMGCSDGDRECGDDEKPAHPVTLAKGYWIGQTEVTQRAYQRIMGSNPSTFKGPLLPVEGVSWDNAQTYCRAVGMRLPTEAEWEFAARGMNPSGRYGAVAAVAWYVGNSGSKTHEVGQKDPNGFNLYDTLGNVWEWVADWYDEKYYQSSPTKDPRGAVSGPTRGVRGGSWGSASRFARVSFRGEVSPGSGANVGVRCAGESL